MGIFRRSNTKSILFLMPVRISNEKLPRGKVRMLYCDTAGKLYAPLIDRSVYKLARGSAQNIGKRNKYFATIGLESSPGEYIPKAVEINYEEELALESILAHSLRSGRLPDILKKYLKSIIKLGEEANNGVLTDNRLGKRPAKTIATPQVLNRLPYYSEQDMEISLPIYKAEQSYPLIILKRLPEHDQTPADAQRLLILDNDGDMAITEMPLKLVDTVEKGLGKWNIGNSNRDSSICMVISKRNRGFSINHIEITQLQRRALDTITSHFEQTGYDKQSPSTSTRKVVTKAKDEALS